MEHILKLDPLLFPLVLNNEKRAEIRRDDREPPFAVGDVLKLRQTKFNSEEMKNGAPLEYTGHECRRAVTHCLRGEEYGLAEGHVLMSIRPLKQSEKAQ